VVLFLHGDDPLFCYINAHFRCVRKLLSFPKTLPSLIKLQIV